MSRVRLSDWLVRAGAATTEDATRWTIDLCRILAASPELVDVRLELLTVDADGNELALQRTPFAGTPRELIARVAGLAYELIKGAPPELPLSSSAWVGVRPQLAQTLGAAIDGTGATDFLTLAAQLGSTASNTASYELGKHDTLMSGGPAASSRAGRAGTLLGSYELEALLGEGGMGEVYRARHVRLGREVAVKLLRPEYANNPDIVHRFFQEARVVNEINHPHIVQIIDFVESPGAVYCVMELLRGRALSTLMKEDGPLALARITRLLEQACDALAAAHARGVVHRDIKPDNLFVTLDANGDEQLKVLDFGIARRLSSADGAKTRAGIVMGTPSYMPPEQAAGRQVDARADVYSLGVVVFELLTATAMADVAGVPPRVTKTALGEPVPPALADVVTRSLSLDSAKRPASVDAFRDALSAKPTSRRFVVGLGAVAIAAALIFAVWPGEAPTERPTFDAGVALVAPVVVDAGPVANEPRDAAVVVTQFDVPDAGTPPRATTAADAVRRRAHAVKRRYDALVKKFGASQLTSIERQTVAAALNDGLSVRDATQLLGDAEAALNQAERRLDH